MRLYIHPNLQSYSLMCVCVRAGDSVSARVFVFQFVFCFPLYD